MTRRRLISLVMALILLLGAVGALVLFSKVPVARVHLELEHWAQLDLTLAKTPYKDPGGDQTILLKASEFGVSADWVSFSFKGTDRSHLEMETYIADDKGVPWGVFDDGEKKIVIFNNMLRGDVEESLPLAVSWWIETVSNPLEIGYGRHQELIFSPKRRTPPPNARSVSYLPPLRISGRSLLIMLGQPHNGSASTRTVDARVLLPESEVFRVGYLVDRCMVTGEIAVNAGGASDLNFLIGSTSGGDRLIQIDAPRASTLRVELPLSDVLGIRLDSKTSRPIRVRASKVGEIVVPDCFKLLLGLSMHHLRSLSARATRGKATVDLERYDLANSSISLSDGVFRFNALGGTRVVVYGSSTALQINGQPVIASRWKRLPGPVQAAIVGAVLAAIFGLFLNAIRGGEGDPAQPSPKKGRKRRKK